MQCRFTDYTVPYIKHSDTHKQTAHLITLQLARSFTAPLVACANCMTCYPNHQCGSGRFSNKYALDVSGLWEDRCVWVCICVSFRSLSLFRSLRSGLFFSRASPYWLHYFSRSSIFLHSPFHPQQLYYCLSSFFHPILLFFPTKFLLCFLSVSTADFSQSSYRGYTTFCPSWTNISTFYLFHSLCLFSSENINFST